MLPASSAGTDRHPASKADYLNQIIQAIFLHEKEKILSSPA